jgi:uncharacterized protein YwqG
MRLFTSLAEASKAISEAGLQQWHDQLLALARPTVHYQVEGRAAHAATGASRLGGTPDLPSAMEWPLRPPYTDAETRNAEIRFGLELQTREVRERGERRNRLIGASARLPFLAQIDLTEAWQAQKFDIDLPDHGRLLFFYDARECPEGFDPADAAGFRVIWDDTGNAELVRAPSPDELAIDALIFPEKSLSPPAAGFVLPEWETYAYESTGIPLSELNNYAHMLRPYDAASYDQWPDSEKRPHHYLGGWNEQPGGARGHMELTCELASNGIYAGSGFTKEHAEQARKRHADWCLLAGFDCGEFLEETEHEWFARHYLTFWIRRNDLAARRFENAWVVAAWS